MRCDYSSNLFYGFAVAFVCFKNTLLFRLCLKLEECIYRKRRTRNVFFRISVGIKSRVKNILTEVLTQCLQNNSVCYAKL